MFQFTVKQEWNTYQKMYFYFCIFWQYEIYESDNGYERALVCPPVHSPSARHWIYQEQQRQLMHQSIVSHLYKVNIDLSTTFQVLVKSSKTM